MPEDSGKKSGADEKNGRPSGPRPFWSGSLTFGLVNVPVRLYSAVRSTGSSLRMVSADGRPLEQRYVCPAEGRPVSRDEIVRGYDVSDPEDDGKEFVTVTQEELEGLQPKKSREIDLRRFVPVEDLDPVFFERAYFLSPAEGSTKAYRLLARVMEETGRAGVASFVMRSKEYLVAILARDGILRAETMRFHDEVRTQEHVGLPHPGDAPEERTDALEAAVRELEEDGLDRSELEDRRDEELEALVARKRKAGSDVVDLPEEEREKGARGAEVIDLIEVLRRSLEGGGDGDEARPVAAERDDGLGDRTRDELYERAQELDIPGRSSMKKAELVEAIRRVG